MWAVAIMGSNP